jgi:2-oxoisovalerate dehydrogenase E2 component (dihydrolipoyl transacylase)
MRAMARAARLPADQRAATTTTRRAARHEGVHIGIATQTPNGLIVPVVRHAEALDVWAARERSPG